MAKTISKITKIFFTLNYLHCNVSLPLYCKVPEEATTGLQSC